MEVAEVEKAIEKLNGFKNITILYGGTFGMTIEQLKQIQEAIETVLQELENKDVEIYKLKQTNKLQENSIPKQKIKYKIEELREGNEVITQEEYYARNYVKKFLQDLLEG